MGSPQSPTLPNPGKMLKCLPPVGPPALSKSYLQNWGSSNVPGPTITPVPALPRDTSILAFQNGSKASGPLDALLCTPDLSVLCLQHKSTSYHLPALPCPLQAIPRTAAVTPSAGSEPIIFRSAGQTPSACGSYSHSPLNPPTQARCLLRAFA